MAVLAGFERVKELAKIESQGNPALHNEILEAIHGLQLDVESPSDTLFRVRLRPYTWIFVCRCTYVLKSALSENESIC